MKVVGAYQFTVTVASTVDRELRDRLWRHIIAAAANAHAVVDRRVIEYEDDPTIWGEPEADRA